MSEAVKCKVFPCVFLVTGDMIRRHSLADLALHNQRKAPLAGCSNGESGGNKISPIV